MAAFSVSEHRKHLLAIYGVQRLLDVTIDSARQNGAIASYALSCINEAVRAALCHLDDEATALLDRAHEWLQIAITEGEDVSFLHCDEGNRHLKLALCEWLLANRIDRTLLATACDYYAKYFGVETDKTEVASHLPAFVIAEQYRDVVRHFAASKKLERPANLNRIKCPGKMSLLFAEHHLRQRPNHETLGAAFRGFLKYQLPVCLGVRSQGLGTLQDVPTWVYLDLAYFHPKQSVGVQSLRHVAHYVQVDA